jgi:anti-anti-sigma regulatory factor
MRNVARLDSAGIGMLVSKYLTACRKGGSLKLLLPAVHSRYLLEITKLSTVLNLRVGGRGGSGFGVEPV